MRAVWEAQGFIDDHIKKAILVSALQDRALSWYIKFSNDNLNARVADIQATLNREFSRHNVRRSQLWDSKRLQCNQERHLGN